MLGQGRCPGKDSAKEVISGLHCVSGGSWETEGPLIKPLAAENSCYQCQDSSAEFGTLEGSGSYFDSPVVTDFSFLTQTRIRGSGIRKFRTDAVHRGEGEAEIAADKDNEADAASAHAGDRSRQSVSIFRLEQALQAALL